ncbi:acyl-CoA N-acyltransferase [Aspergillus unguis]
MTYISTNAAMAISTLTPKPAPTPAGPSTKCSIKITKATPSQVPTIQSIIASAFTRYIPVLGRLPTPMQADFDEILRTPGRAVYVLSDTSFNSLSNTAASWSSSHSHTIPLGRAYILATMTIRIPDPASDDSIDEETKSVAYKDAMQVNYFAVSPSAQGHGYGRVLLKFAEAKVREEGKSAVMLFTGENFHESIAFYKKLGFREVGRGPKRQRVYMRKELRTSDSAL